VGCAFGQVSVFRQALQTGSGRVGGQHFDQLKNARNALHTALIRIFYGLVLHNASSAKINKKFIIYNFARFCSHRAGIVPHCGIKYTSKRRFSQVASHKAEPPQYCQKRLRSDW
jgi:hypothetical protein